MVSPEVAAKLDPQKKAGVPYRLAPHEWKSGKERRVLDAIGERKAVQTLIQEVRSHSRTTTSKK